SFAKKCKNLTGKVLKFLLMPMDELHIPHYRKIYEMLRRHIEEGVYQEGDMLPSENELSKLHNLARPTVRQALDALVKDGYIKKHRGKGSIVSKRDPGAIGILSIVGTTSAVGRHNLQTKILTPPTVEPWEEPFFYKLSKREKESGCIRLERLRLVKDVPVFYDINYLPNINLPRFTSRKMENKSLFEVLRKNYKIDVIGGDQRIRAIPADEKVARYLRIAEGSPVLHLQRKLETNRNGYCFYSSLYCNTEEYSLYGKF
ncbi:MAG: GntR family transcriptional regulator, partial [Bacteroidales bacterium]